MADAPAPMVPAARPMISAWFWVPGLLTLVLDLFSKWYLFTYPLSDPPGFIELHHNPGVAWGMFGEYPWLVSLMTAVLIPVLVVVWWRTYRLGPALENLAFGCILGGALGNAYDRMLTNVFHSLLGVRDFIKVDLHVVGIDYVWPVFNIADSGITIGFIALLLASFLNRPEQANVTKGT